VLVGSSTGGPPALEALLTALPAAFPWPILVAQHMPANFTDTFSRRMDSLCALTVVEVASAMAISAGNVYIGRGGTDITVTARAGVLHVAPRPETPTVLWHPSVEVMVDSAMQHLAPRHLLGVMLTGMGNDGADAMARLHAAGMPNELIERRGATLVLPCTAIAAQLRHWLH
jgi:two-component system chemotaxis response regulator CheB